MRQRQDARVASSIPSPPKPTRSRVLSVRLTEDEEKKVDRARELLAWHWQREQVKDADVIRAALDTLLAELEKEREKARPV